MRAVVIAGKLVYVDTEDGEIQIMDRTDHQVTDLNIDQDTKLPTGHSWEMLVGDDIEAVVINGKTQNVYLLTEEEQQLIATTDLPQDRLP